MYSHIYPCFPFETIIDYMSIMKTWITGVVLLVLVLQVTARAKTEPRVSELTPEQMRKSICMSLSRMHIEDHMDSIEEVLDSEDEDRTMKLATILDKSFRRCMKNVELDLNKLGKSYFLGLDDKEAAGREIEKVFGEVEYEKDGKLMDPYSVEQSMEDREGKRVKQRSKEKQPKVQPKANLKPRFKGIKVPETNKKTQVQQVSNYEYSQENASEQQTHSRQQSASEFHNSEDEVKELTIEPEEDIMAEIERPLQDSSKSVLVYIYPLLLIGGLIHYRFPNLYSRFSKGKQRLELKENWDDALKSNNDLDLIMEREEFEKVQEKMARMRSNENWNQSERRKIQGYYRKYLNKIYDSHPDKPKVRQELAKTDRLHAFIIFSSSGSSDEDIINRLKTNQLNLIEQVNLLSPDQLSQALLQLYPYASQAFFQSIRNIFLSNPQPSLSYLRRYIFKRKQIDERNAVTHNLQLPPLVRKKYVKTLVEIIAGEYNNLKIAEQVIEEILQDDYSKEEGEILFAIKMASIFVYQYFHIEYDYFTVKKMTKTKVFSVYFAIRKQEIKDLSELAPILKYLKSKDSRESKYIEENYAFTTECPLLETIELFKLDILKVYHFSAISLMNKIKQGSIQVGLLYPQISAILKPYRQRKQVKEFLRVLKCCQILSSYRVIRSFKDIESIVTRTMTQRANNLIRESKSYLGPRPLSLVLPDIEMQAASTVELPIMNVTDQILLIYIQMINGFCSMSLNKDTKLVVSDKSIWDLQNPYNLLQCIRYLRENFYGARESMKVYDIAYKNILKSKARYEGKLAIQKIMTKQVINEFLMSSQDSMDAEMDETQNHELIIDQVKSYVKEFVEEKLLGCDRYKDVSEHIEEVLKVIREIDKRFKDPPDLDLIKYLDSKGCTRPPSEILAKVDKRLYELMLDNESIKESELDAKINNVVKKGTQDPQEKKCVRMYRIQNAKKLFGSGKMEEGLKELKKIEKEMLGSYCSLILEIIEMYPKTERILLKEGYRRIYASKDFERIRAKYNQQYTFEEFIKRYNTNQYPCEGEIIRDETEYLAAIKNQQSELSKRDQYKLFFYLLGTRHQEAFFYAYKKGLSISFIDKFITRCKTKIVPKEREDKCDRWMEKLLFFSCIKKYLGGETVSYKEFSGEHQELGDAFNKHRVVKIVKEKQREKGSGGGEERELLELLLKYYYNRLIIQLRNTDERVLEDLKVNQTNGSIPLAEEVTRQICKKLNSLGDLELSSSKLWRNVSGLVTVNLTTLSECSKIILNTLNKLSYVANLLEPLIKYSDNTNPYRFDPNNALMIKMLGKVEEQSEFKGIFHPQFLYTPLQIPLCPTQSLPTDTQNIVTKSIKHSNVFLLARILYNVYGRNPSIQKQIYQIFQTKLKQPPMVRKFRQEIQEYKKLQK